MSVFQLSILNYWMFEILFFERFNARLFNTKIYRHHTFSLIFILFFCSIMQTIIIIMNFVNDTKKVKIFDDEKWLIPIGVIFTFLSNIFRAYVYNNEKYYLEKRYISIIDYLLIYGIFGALSTFFCAILASYVPCGDNSLPEFSKIVCSYVDDDEIYYIDSYKIFFKEFASDYLSLRIVLKIIDIILYYISNYYIYVIYKILSPIYHIYMKRLNSLIFNILELINYSINDDDIQSLDVSLNVLNILLLLFFILGSLVYLEFIELNFFGLNFYLKRKIKERANSESMIHLNTIDDNAEMYNEEKNEDN